MLELISHSGVSVLETDMLSISMLTFGGCVSPASIATPEWADVERSV